MILFFAFEGKNKEFNKEINFSLNFRLHHGFYEWDSACWLWNWILRWIFLKTKSLFFTSCLSTRSSVYPGTFTISLLSKLHVIQFSNIFRQRYIPFAPIFAFLFAFGFVLTDTCHTFEMKFTTIVQWKWRLNTRCFKLFSVV